MNMALLTEKMKPQHGVLDGGEMSLQLDAPLSEQDR